MNTTAARIVRLELAAQQRRALSEPAVRIFLSFPAAESIDITNITAISFDAGGPGEIAKRPD